MLTEAEKDFRVKEFIAVYDAVQAALEKEREQKMNQQEARLWDEAAERWTDDGGPVASLDRAFNPNARQTAPYDSEVEKMHESSPSKGLKTNVETANPALSLSQVQHYLTFVFENFTPAHFDDVMGVYGVPVDAEYEFDKDEDDRHVVSVWWEETLS